MEQEKLAAYEVLRGAIEGETKTQVSTLHEQSVAILENDSYRSTVGAAYARISNEHHLTDLDGILDKPHYAKIVQLVNNKGEPLDDQEPFFFLDETKDNKLVSKVDKAMFFDTFGSEFSLRVDHGNELDVSVNNPHHLALASEIIASISEKVSPKIEAEIIPTRKERRAERRRAKKRHIKRRGEMLRDPELIDKYFQESSGKNSWHKLNEDKKLKILTRQELLVRRGGATALLLVGYSHLLAGFGSADVVANVGPVPVPLPLSPIEFIVDLNNSPDHAAEGFSKPENALDVTIGDTVDEVPVLNDYDTSGAPNSFYGNNLWVSGSGSKYESKNGLYELSVTRQRDLLEDRVEIGAGKNSHRVTSDGCKLVEGNFKAGETSVFTQTPEITDHLKIDIIDIDTAKVCLANTSPVEGSVFFYQK